MVAVCFPLQLVNRDETIIASPRCLAPMHLAGVLTGSKLDGAESLLLAQVALFIPARPRAPDGGEKHADYLDVCVDDEHIASMEEVGVAEDEDELHQVEDDGEDEV